MKIVLLCGMSESSQMVYNGINKTFGIEQIIQEKPISKKKLIEGRVKRLGYFTVFNQLLFQIGVTPILTIFYRNRKLELIEKYRLNLSDTPEEKLTIVDSVNNIDCKELLEKIKPDLVIVNGTRIISKKILALCPLFINIHTGITPEYRGVHGAYWSLVNHEPDKCGVTVHKVDAGIDTGEILVQEVIDYNLQKDSFITYPIHQTAKGISLLLNVLKQIEANKLVSYKKDSPVSKLYYHPTLSVYIMNLFKGIR